MMLTVSACHEIYLLLPAFSPIYAAKASLINTRDFILHKLVTVCFYLPDVRHLFEFNIVTKSRQLFMKEHTRCFSQAEHDKFL